MIFRRIWHLKNPWSSGGRFQWLSHSYATQTMPSTAVLHGRNPPLIWVTSRAFVSKYATTSFLSANKLNYLSISHGTKGCLFSSHASMAPTTEGTVDVPLAQTGEGIAECELLKWFVREGDQVEEFQQLCEVQSDKATIEITSRYKGKVSQILHNPGDIVKVGETLLKMLVGESSVAAQTSDALGKLNSIGSDTSDSDEQSSLLKKADGGGVLSTPVVRGLAKQHGINLNDIFGTGENGRVLKEDVLNYAAQKGLIKDNTASLGAASSEEFLGSKSICTDVPAAYKWDFEDKTVKLRGYQRAMVKSMTMAAKIPHFHYVEDINCNALVKLKASFQQEKSDPNVKHTFLPILIKSLSMALSKYPMLNSCFNEELYEVTLRGWHNIGIAMATPSGLVVPNIKKVQSLSILEITKELSRLQQLALANKLNPDDVSGGTITLSNIGAIGGKFGSPLVNVPEVSIIALGRIQKLPHFADDGTVYPVSVMSVNIGSDHRVLDGATVAKFCTEWKQIIERPELLLLHTR